MTLARHLFALTLAVGLPFGPANAEELPAPTGDILLTVSGNVPVTNVGDTAQFDMTLLQSLDAVSFTTTTPWTVGEQNFTGVSLRDLLDRLEVSEGTLSAKAINDYGVDIPISDAVEDGPIIAYLQDGNEMSVRENGPLWIVYPYDLNQDYQAEVIYSRSIWQLDRLEVSE